MYCETDSLLRGISNVRLNISKMHNSEGAEFIWGWTLVKKKKKRQVAGRAGEMRQFFSPTGNQGRKQVSNKAGSGVVTGETEAGREHGWIWRTICREINGWLGRCMYATGLMWKWEVDCGIFTNQFSRDTSHFSLPSHSSPVFSPDLWQMFFFLVIVTGSGSVQPVVYCSVATHSRQWEHTYFQTSWREDFMFLADSFKGEGNAFCEKMPCCQSRKSSSRGWGTQGSGLHRLYWAGGRNEHWHICYHVVIIIP